MDNLRQIAFFQLFDILYGLPTLTSFKAFILTSIQQIVIIGMVGITIILIHNFIERVLFLDISLQIYNNKIQ